MVIDTDTAICKLLQPVTLVTDNTKQIDKIYLGPSNQDGYETRKVSVRSVRKPMIGDMYCLQDTTNILL